jgi:hypothetical protein
VAVHQGVVAGVRRAPRLGVNSGSGGAALPITVGRDGPGGVYVPASSPDWVQLALPVPTAQWSCQEASGNLASSIGSIALTATGSNLVYAQTVTGWSRGFVGFSAETANSRWSTTSATLDAAAGQSVAWLVYASAQAASTAQRLILTASVAPQNTIRASTTAWQHVHASTAATMASTPLALDNVRALIWYRNGTSNVSGMISPTENHLGTHDETVYTGGTIKGLGTSGSTCAVCRVGLVCVWMGADAETIAQSSTLTKLGW